MNQKFHITPCEWHFNIPDPLSLSSVLLGPLYTGTPEKTPIQSINTPPAETTQASAGGVFLGLHRLWSHQVVQPEPHCPPSRERKPGIEPFFYNQTDPPFRVNKNLVKPFISTLPLRFSPFRQCRFVLDHTWASPTFCFLSGWDCWFYLLGKPPWESVGVSLRAETAGDARWTMWNTGGFMLYWVYLVRGDWFLPLSRNLPLRRTNIPKHTLI